MRHWVIAAALVLPAAAFGHHGWSEYDASRPLELTGRIVESGYEHPHGHVRLQAEGRTWRVVLAPPSRMERRGLAKEALKPGALVTVQGYPSRDEPEEMRAESITAGGKTIALR